MRNARQEIAMKAMWDDRKNLLHCVSTPPLLLPSHMALVKSFNLSELHFHLKNGNSFKYLLYAHCVLGTVLSAGDLLKSIIQAL